MMKRIDYVDNLFDDDFVARVSTKYHTNLWRYGHTSNRPDASVFWVSDRLADFTPLIDCPDQKIIFDKIKEYYKFEVGEFRDEDIYINGQTYELEGQMHIDCSHKQKPTEKYTIIYMVNYHSDNMQGFETYQNTVDFVPGRVVIFDSIMPHRGLSTSVKNKCRMTLTWKSFDLVFDKTSPIML